MLVVMYPPPPWDFLQPSITNATQNTFIVVNNPRSNYKWDFYKKKDLSERQNLQLPK